MTDIVRVPVVGEACADKWVKESQDRQSPPGALSCAEANPEAPARSAVERALLTAMVYRDAAKADMRAYGISITHTDESGEIRRVDPLDLYFSPEPPK